MHHTANNIVGTVVPLSAPKPPAAAAAAAPAAGFRVTTRTRGAQSHDARHPHPSHAPFQQIIRYDAKRHRFSRLLYLPATQAMDIHHKKVVRAGAPSKAARGILIVRADDGGALVASRNSTRDLSKNV